MAKENAETKEFLQKKELLELQQGINRENHEMKMKELQFKRESDHIHHEYEMERQRIKIAEIRKSQDRKYKQRLLEQHGRP